MQWAVYVCLFFFFFCDALENERTGRGLCSSKPWKKTSSLSAARDRFYNNLNKKPDFLFIESRIFEILLVA